MTQEAEPQRIEWSVYGPKLRDALRALAGARALAGVRNQVAGWNGEGRDIGPFKRHPDKLGAQLPKTTCGAVYELDEAMTNARAILAQIGETE